MKFFILLIFLIQYQCQKDIYQTPNERVNQEYNEDQKDMYTATVKTFLKNQRFMKRSYQDVEFVDDHVNDEGIPLDTRQETFKKLLFDSFDFNNNFLVMNYLESLTNYKELSPNQMHIFEQIIKYQELLLAEKRNPEKRKMMTDFDMDELMSKIYEVTHAIDFINNSFHIKTIHRSIDSEKMLIDIYQYINDLMNSDQMTPEQKKRLKNNRFQRSIKTEKKSNEKTNTQFNKSTHIKPIQDQEEGCKKPKFNAFDSIDKQNKKIMESMVMDMDNRFKKSIPSFNDIDDLAGDLQQEVHTIKKHKGSIRETSRTLNHKNIIKKREMEIRYGKKSQKPKNANNIKYSIKKIKKLLAPFVTKKLSKKNYSANSIDDDVKINNIDIQDQQQKILQQIKDNKSENDDEIIKDMKNQQQNDEKDEADEIIDTLYKDEQDREMKLQTEIDEQIAQQEAKLKQMQLEEAGNQLQKDQLELMRFKQKKQQ